MKSKRETNICIKWSGFILKRVEAKIIPKKKKKKRVDANTCVHLFLIEQPLLPRRMMMHKIPIRGHESMATLHCYTDWRNEMLTYAVKCLLQQRLKHAGNFGNIEYFLAASTIRISRSVWSICLCGTNGAFCFRSTKRIEKFGDESLSMSSSAIGSYVATIMLTVVTKITSSQDGFLLI